MEVSEKIDPDSFVSNLIKVKLLVAPRANREFSVSTANLIAAESNRADNLKHELATLRSSLAVSLYPGSVRVAELSPRRAGEAPVKPKHVQPSTF